MSTSNASRSGSPRSRSSKTAGRSPAPRLRASKISITVDAGVLHEVKRLIRRTGASLSAHVTQALERDLRQQRLQDIIDAYEAENGTITDDELAEVRAQWRG